MFGGKKKPERPKRDHSGRNLSQYGLFEVPQGLDTGLGSMDDDNDEDLEAELAALAGGGGSKPKKPAKKAIPQADLDNMVAASMRDIPSDEELSGDDDDPALLSELQEIAGAPVEEDPAPSPPQQESQPPPTSNNTSTDMGDLLNTRLKMYETAEAHAKANNESGKARRYGRAIKTLKDLIKQAKAGKNIDPEEIPPVVSVPQNKPAENQGNDSAPNEPVPTTSQNDSSPASPPAPQPEENPAAAATVTVDTELLGKLTSRQKEYKIAALTAKKSGDTSTALKFIKIAKQFDSVISAVQSGQPVDLSRMPGPPDTQKKPEIEQAETQKNTEPSPPSAEPDIPEPTLITASSIGEALDQRLAFYKGLEDAAKEQDNPSKLRRLGRIVKQFEQAIKLHKAGKPVPVDELPTPPGYGPIPVSGAAAPKPAPAPVAPRPAPKATAEDSSPGSSGKPSPSSGQSVRISGNHVPTTRAEKQVIILLAKQKQFKIAALNAKKKGEISEAKEFLRQAKGFDKLIDAARGGLPVDFSSIPVSPDAKSQLDNEYDIVMTDECTESDSNDMDVITRLETQLTKQLKMCLSTRDHNKALGDVAGTNRFERLALSVTKDLDVVRLAHRTPGAGVPKFHYEKKDFSIVKSFTDLAENDMELLIVRGISYASSKDIDTYVKFEFPFPQEEPYSDKTSTVKDSINPEYNATFTIPIQRAARNCQRVFKRHSLKLEVYSKGGFFRGDTLIGTVNVKLQPLETSCELHESFDLMEGRKKIGGKLEVRLRLRHPIVTQQVEQVQEKWLVLDH